LFHRREKLGQTISTSINNYLKNLGNLVDTVISTYCYDDPGFPRSFDNKPRTATSNSIKVLKKKLGLLYKSKLQKRSAELFLRKTEEITTLPEYAAVKKTLDLVESEIPEFLTHLDQNFGADDVVRMSEIVPAWRRW